VYALQRRAVKHVRAFARGLLVSPPTTCRLLLFTQSYIAAKSKVILSPKPALRALTDGSAHNRAAIAAAASNAGLEREALRIDVVQPYVGHSMHSFEHVPRNAPDPYTTSCDFIGDKNNHRCT
jgi:hypothetical protein